ncbi:hypothetical protein TrVE_jg535 [Triparma verrucosa]|uniref:Uncharacterized protein n=1 Tax=Triparma verrucosa TaxID=1606542 RepID=A0A9W7B2A2_9STRA|nr:hypothetical protein TrVE_jg535 [Triparma verrucosa]
MSDGGIPETGGSVGSAGGKTSVVVRVQPWDEAGMREARRAEKERKLNEAQQQRPRFHAREMNQEEERQRKVERYFKNRAESFVWLENRVREGRVELLKRSRLTGVEKEVRGLWFKQGRTVPGNDLLQEVWGGGN